MGKKKSAPPAKKNWTWPYGLADQVYQKIRAWHNTYHSRGRIHKAMRVPHERFGEEMPKTKVLMRVHTLQFNYNQLKWLSGILQLEDPDTTQAHILAKTLEIFEEKQQTGRATPGISLPFDLALTEDEVNYIRKLLECIGVWRRPTPSELEAAGEDVAKGDW